MEMRQDGSASACWEHMGEGRKVELAQAHGTHGQRGLLLLLPQAAEPVGQGLPGPQSEGAIPKGILGRRRWQLPEAQQGGNLQRGRYGYVHSIYGQLSGQVEPVR